MRRNLLTAIILALILGITVSVMAGTTADALAESEESHIVGVIVDGKPPETTVAAASVPEPNTTAGTNIISDVPAFDWSYGCSATSAAMLFGYYDRTGYSNMYAGPTNGGVCPLDNSAWGSGGTYNECPLSATHNGIDERTIRGHVDDYWIDYGDAGPDPFIGNWTEHTWGDCTGDYMGTNQSSFESTDGSTWFYFNDDGSALYNYTGCEPARRDGCHGMREFAESRDYSVVTNFSQYIQGYDGNALGFTFDNFKAEIDAGRPMLIHVEGHTMLGYGYDDTSSDTIYIHDTWDNSAHTMTWGGTYPYGSIDLQHYGVTVIHIADTTNPSATITNIDDSVNSLTTISGTASDTNNGIASVQLYIYNSTDDKYWDGSSWEGSETWLDATGTTSWSYDSSSVSFADGKQYTIKAKATDDAGNVTDSGDIPSDSFTYDSTAPSGSLNIDSGAAYASSTSVTLNLSATDALGVTQYKIANGSDASGASATAVTSTTSYNADISWTLSTGDGSKTVAIMYGDAAGNWSGNYTHSITLDTTSPSATITDIDGYVNSLTSISGTASDTSPGELEKVQVMIKDITGDKYWNGSNWIDTEIWIDASDTSTWNYGNMPSLTDGRAYVVKAKSIDKAGNESSEATDGFIYDITNPSVTITDINDYINTLDTITGTSSDTSPGEPHKVQLVIKNTTDGKYWNEDSSSWVTSTTEIWLEDASGTHTWSYTMPYLTDGEAYLVKAKSIDEAGNESPETSDTFTYDTTNPSTALSDISEFVNAMASISGTASDTAPGELEKVQLVIKDNADSTYWDGDSWETTVTWLTASGTSSWSYDSGSVTLTDGKNYTVQAKSTDKAENEPAAVSDSFKYDATKPVVSLTDIADFVNELASVSGSASDTSSGELNAVKLMITNTTDDTCWDGSDWMDSETWVDASGTTSWDYTMPGLTEGKTYLLKAKSLDEAGNESDEASGSFTYDTTDPSATIIDISGYVQSLPSVSGTSSDIPPGEIEKVQVIINNTTDDTYWNGVVWLHTLTWLDASGRASWSYDMPSLIKDKAYEIRVKSIDKAGNESSVETVNFKFGVNIFTDNLLLTVIIGGGIVIAIVIGLAVLLRLRKR